MNANGKEMSEKKLKNLGKEYTSISGKVVCEKKMRTGCSENCKRKCHESFDCEKRNEIFEQFWSAGEINQQRQFIADHVQRIATKRKTTGKEASSRKFSFLYCLSVENCQASSVCKKFFFGYPWHQRRCGLSLRCMQEEMQRWSGYF